MGWFPHAPPAKDEGVRRLEELNKKIEEVLNSLRLFKPGLMGPESTYYLDKGWTPNRNRVSASRFSQPSYFGSAYVLTNSELPNFTTFYRELKTFNLRDVAVAMRRFNFCYDRTEVEDKLLDVMIAFENILLPERDELSLRLAIRASRMLGATEEERRAVFDFFRVAYDIRSSIAHGGECPSYVRVSETRTLEIRVFVQGLEDYLRSTILMFLRMRRSKTKSTIMDELTNPF